MTVYATSYSDSCRAPIHALSLHAQKRLQYLFQITIQIFFSRLRIKDVLLRSLGKATMLVYFGPWIAVSLCTDACRKWKKGMTNWNIRQAKTATSSKSLTLSCTIMIMESSLSMSFSLAIMIPFLASKSGSSHAWSHITITHLYLQNNMMLKCSVAHSDVPNFWTCTNHTWRCLGQTDHVAHDSCRICIVLLMERTKVGLLASEHTCC